MKIYPTNTILFRRRIKGNTEMRSAALFSGRRLCLFRDIHLLYNFGSNERRLFSLSTHPKYWYVWINFLSIRKYWHDDHVQEWLSTFSILYFSISKRLKRQSRRHRLRQTASWIYKTCTHHHRPRDSYNLQHQKPATSPQHWSMDYYALSRSLAKVKTHLRISAP